METPSEAHVLIIGGGISGLATALSLSTFLSKPARITIYEARTELPTLGGAINLTPNGQRYLWRIGALAAVRARGGADVRAIDLFALASGARMGQIDFAQPDGRGLGAPAFHALRIRRADLLRGMLDAARQHACIRVEFGKKLARVDDGERAVRVAFADGSCATGALLLGCDGIHSAVRRHLEPARAPQYTGVAIANGYAAVRAGCWRPLRDTSFLSARAGRFFASYYEPERQNLFVTGLWETPDVPSRDGWRAKADAQVALQRELRHRFGHGPFLGVAELIDAVQEWCLYPVYNLPPNGTWWRGHTMLLGDAAHAMSPQGESATIAMEDSVLFARLLARQADRPLAAVFAAYERERRPRVDAAYKEADYRWNTIKDPGWLAYKIQEWLTPLFLWATAGKRRCTYEEDLTTLELDF